MSGPSVLSEQFDGPGGQGVGRPRRAPIVACDQADLTGQRRRPEAQGMEPWVAVHDARK